MYTLKAPLTRADFPVSGENVREADKRGAGPAGLSAQLTEGEIFHSQIYVFAYTTKIAVNIQIADSDYCSLHVLQFSGTNRIFFLLFRSIMSTAIKFNN